MGSRSLQSDRASYAALARPTSFSSPYDRSSPPNPHTFNPLRRLFPTRREVPRRSRLQAPFKPNALRIDSAVENSHEKKKKKKKKKKGLPDLLLMKVSALSGHWYIDGWITLLHWTRCYIPKLKEKLKELAWWISSCGCKKGLFGFLKLKRHPFKWDHVIFQP
ncbi:unnamed protein product [Musa hybrid cultivar]